ncbi:MAG: hypothetical protein ACJAVV_002978 [Alphaproteobacteria bacterium]|jgi:hypothetical protein
MQSNDSSSSNDKIDHENVNDSAHESTTKHETPSDTSFFDKPKNVGIIMNSFYALCIILVALEFIVHRHIYLSFEEIPAFYAIYGFVACVVLVVIAKLMRHVVMLNEHYYDERLDEQGSASAAHGIGDALNEGSKEDPHSMDDLGLNSQSSTGDKQL